MDKMTVACVQMRMRLPASVDEYRDDLRRYLRAAESKRARLVLFPEMAGLLVAPLLLRDRRSSLARRAERARRRGAGLWERTRGAMAGWAASLLRADLYGAVAGLLEVDPAAVWTLYADLFGGLAKAHAITIVAPSAYLPGPDGGAIENRCAVFGRDGELLGTQSKVLGYAEDERLVQRGSAWQVIPTDAGPAGIVVGSDILYPEVGRLLAYQGAEFILVQGACPTPAFYNKLRAGTLARMQDNQLFAALSLAVGPTNLREPEARARGDGYVGRSALFAPQELTPRANGVLAEMGAGASDGILTAEWDFVALRNLWETSDTPLRRPLPGAEANLLTSALYAQLRALPQPPAIDLLAGPTEASHAASALPAPEPEAAAVIVLPEPAPAEEPAADLDDLPLLGAVTSRWPLRARAETDPGGEQLLDWPPRQTETTESPALAAPIRREDETDEMDAVAGGKGDASAQAEADNAESSERTD